MRQKNIKTTIEWSNHGVFFQKLGKGLSKKAQDFNQYVFNLPMSVNKGKMYGFLQNIADTYVKSDVSESVFKKEDNTMFDSSTPFIDVVLRHLKNIDQGGEVKAHWCYLDSEKKAVVHFVNKLGWYAEVYVLSDTEASYVHLFEDDFGHKAVIPVLFTKNILPMKEKASVTGGVFLHEYLPRQTVEILGKNGSAFNKKKSTARDDKGYRRKKDNKDNL